MTPRPAHLCLIVGAGLAGSCITAPPPRGPIAAPPERLVMYEHYRPERDGYAVLLGYFTAAQLRDPAWEARRREMMRRYGYCRGSVTMLRRQTRWHAATPLSRQRCASIVYSFRCAVPARGGRPGPERERLFLLRDDPDPPIGRDCGEKDAARLPRTVMRSPEAALAPLLSAEAVCTARDTIPDDPIRLHARTRIHVRTLISSDFSAAHSYTISADLHRGAAASGLRYAFSLAAFVEPRIRASAIEDDGVNILVTQAYALDPAGRPYCVELTARQGSRIWRRHVARAGLGDLRIGDPRPSWNPLTDASRLGSELGAYLIRRSDPVYRMGRAGGPSSSRIARKSSV